MTLPAVEFEAAMKQAIAAQQPFFVGLLNQIASIEARQGKQAETIQDTRDTVQRLINLELLERLKSVENELNELKAERSERRGLIKAFDWIPKAMQYAAMFVLLVVAWFSGKKGILPNG